MFAAITLSPSLVTAAPLSLDTRVSLLWPAALGAGMLLCATAAVTLVLRLRRAVADGEARAEALKYDNSRIHRQLQAYSSELASREQRLAEAREALEQQSRKSDDLQAIISHQLRQPLNAVHSTLDLLARDSDPDSSQLAKQAQRQLQSARQALERIQCLNSAEAVQSMQAADSTSLAILLVENSSRKSLKAQLEGRGHRVQRENNGVDGVDAALQKHFDLVLIDSKLPLVNGMEAAQKIRRAAGRELPIFALVSDPSDGDKQRYQARGLSGVLVRPVADGQLQQLLDWVSRRPRQAGGDSKRARATRILNTDTLCRQRDIMGHLAFAELLSDRIATLPKKTTALTSWLTGRHWIDAERQARAIADSADEIGLEAAAARLRALGARLSIDSEREYCRHQRTEVLDLMRSSIQQLKAWREQNVHSEWALK